MAAVGIQHIALLLFISGLATVKAEMLECTSVQIDKCSEHLNDVKDSELCNGVLDEAQTCWDTLVETCELTDGQTTTKVEAEKGIKESKDGCPATTCSDADIETCKNNLAMVEKQQNFCRAWDSMGGCFKNLTMGCLNKTVDMELKDHIKAMEMNFTDQKCCSVLEMSKCGENRVEVTNTTATKADCMKIKEGKSCLEKLMCEEKDMKKDIDAGIKEMDGFLAICKAAGYSMSDNDGDSGNAIQPALVLLFSAVVCALYGLVV